MNMFRNYPPKITRHLIRTYTCKTPHFIVYHFRSCSLHYTIQRYYFMVIPFAVFVMHQYYTNSTTSDVDPIERAVWNALLNTADINASLTIDHPSSQWLLRTEMDKIGATEREEYAVTNNVKENLWYTVFAQYYIKLLLIAHSLAQDPNIYDAQLKHVHDAYLLEPPQSSLDVLFINFQALHMTHLGDSRHFETHALEMIRNFESHFDKVVDLAVNKSLKCVIFRPPNPICTNMYHEKWVGLSQFYGVEVPKMNESELQSNAQIRTCLRDNGINPDEIYYENNVSNVRVRGLDACAKYSMTQYGVEAIDDRIKRYVLNRQNELYDDHGVRLIYYDQLQLYGNYPKHCQTTYDGRHYMELLPVQAVTVLNIIDKWC
eukprot:1153965_1